IGGVFAKHYAANAPVATRLSPVHSEASQDRVLLLWQGTGADNLTATVGRRTSESEWVSVGPANPAGPDQLRFEDLLVQPGQRYAYRLGYPTPQGEMFTEETWVTVPTDLVFALSGLEPNPGAAPLHVRFSLPSGDPARLELLDVSGRRVWSENVTVLGPGRH